MKRAKPWKVAAMILLGLSAGVLLLFTVAETMGGDLSGLGHLIQLLPVVVLMWFGWRRPRLGGWLLLGLGLFVSTSLYISQAGLQLASLLILVLPILLGGALFLVSARLERPAV